jgi:hypothetical protein
MIQNFKISDIKFFIKIILIFIFQLGTINCFSQSIVPIRNTNNNSYEYIDTNSKKVISKFSYDQAAPFSEGLARVSRNGLYGFINLNGDEVIACKYINANNFSEGLASVSVGDLKVTTFMISAENEKYGAIDKSGNIVLPFDFGLIGSFKNKLARARDINSGKWGWINKEGSWKIMPQFSCADDFNEFQLAKVSILKSKEELNSPLSKDAFGYINQKGEFVISPIYGSLSDFQEGITIASKFRTDNVIHYGAINYKGEIVLPLNYDWIYNFENGLAKVSKDKKWGIVDRTGNLKIPIKYRYISNFIEDCAWVNYDNYYGVINKENETKTPFIYDFIIEGIDKNKILVTKNGLWGMFDNRGVEIIPIKYELIERKDSITFIGINGIRHSYFNNQGKLQKEIIDDNWRDIYDKPIKDNWEQCTWSDEDKESFLDDAFYSGYEQDSIKDFFKIIKKNGLLGIKNNEGKIIINQMYDSIKLANRSWFNYRNEDITLACYKGKKVDLCLLEQRNNNTECKILKTDYDLIANYYNEKTLLRVGKNGKFGMVKIINNQLLETIPVIFDAISSVYNDSLVLVKENNLWGIWNISFKNLELGFQLNKIKYFNRGYAVSKNNKWALLNVDFVVNTPFIYDNIKEFPCEENYYFLVNGKWGLITISGDEILRPIITKIILSPNHGNAQHSIYKIGRQSFTFHNSYPIFFEGAGFYETNLTSKVE